MKHEFTEKILETIESDFYQNHKDIFNKSYLLQYINNKTKSANKGDKARGSFGNLYAIYVIIEDYLKKGFDKHDGYSNSYEGAEFSKIFIRQRELPFGAKLQNHALNHRMNSEFKKFFPDIDIVPIVRDSETNRYWINEKLLNIRIGDIKFNIAKTVLKVIDEYINIKKRDFEGFIKTCAELKKIREKGNENAEKFIIALIKPNTSARIFEVISYCILKYYYFDQKIYWGYSVENIKEEQLKLYKTGRTNANDGGIDFVMKPLGRFFQVTETMDVKKYFLDIDKIHRFPITFVVKSTKGIEDILNVIKQNAYKTYSVDSIVNKYIDCIEEIINIDFIRKAFKDAIKNGHLNSILDEIIVQSKVEFNFQNDYVIDEE